MEAVFQKDKNGLVGKLECGARVRVLNSRDAEFEVHLYDVIKRSIPKSSYVAVIIESNSCACGIDPTSFANSKHCFNEKYIEEFLKKSGQDSREYKI